jgi:hypothetical protein
MKRTTGRTTLARTGCKPILIQPAAEHFIKGGTVEEEGLADEIKVSYVAHGVFLNCFCAAASPANVRVGAANNVVRERRQRERQQ